MFCKYCGTSKKLSDKYCKKCGSLSTKHNDNSSHTKKYPIVGNLYNTSRRVIGFLKASSWILWVLILLVFFNWQTITDKWFLVNYNPPDKIEDLANQSSMNDKSKLFFYKSYPEIVNNENYIKHCNSADQQGCYIGDRIFIFDISLPQLKDAMTVTATHEMLHAAYTQLSESKINELKPLLDNELDKHKADLELVERMKRYEITEPGEKYNELHSIVGTEFENISPELEQYYSQYFTNRNSVTLANKKFNARLDSYASDFKDSIDQLVSLRDQLEEYNNDLDYYDSIGDIYSYNDLIPTYNETVEGYNDQRQTVIDDYDRLEIIDKSIKSSLPSIPGAEKAR